MRALIRTVALLLSQIIVDEADDENPGVVGKWPSLLSAKQQKSNCRLFSVQNVFRGRKCQNFLNKKVKFARLRFFSARVLACGEI